MDSLKLNVSLSYYILEYIGILKLGRLYDEDMDFFHGGSDWMKNICS